MLGKEIASILNASAESRRTGFDVLDYQAVEQKVKNEDVVIHAAAIVSGDKELMYKVNVVGTKNVARACRKHNVRMIHISSAGVNTGAKRPITENSEIKPVTYYEKTKAEAERILELVDGLEYSIVRPGLIVGPNKYWMRTFKLIQRVPMFNGYNQFQTINVSDAAKCVKAVVGRGKNGRVYLAVNSEKVILREFYEEMCKIMGIRPKYMNAKVARAGIFILDVFRGIIGKERVGELVRKAMIEREYNNKQTMFELRWSPEIGFRESIKRTYEEIKEKLE